MRCADPNVADEEGITPLHRYLLRPSPRALARAARDVEIVRGMVAHGAEATPLIASFLGAVSFENDTEIRAAMALTAAR